MLLELQKHDSASKQDKVQVWEEQRPVSKNALGLHQEASTGKTIPSDPSQWACAETGVKENLWLNLSTGTIGSGRQASTMTGCCMLMPKAVFSLQVLFSTKSQVSFACPGCKLWYCGAVSTNIGCAVQCLRSLPYTCMQNWDGTGGNGAALRHFEATGSKYPLVVKLGTITPHGADVFSYAPDENDMVEDPKLVRQWIPCSLMWTATWHAIDHSNATCEHFQ